MNDNLTPILEVAKEILKPAGLKGMHVDAIADEALKMNKNMSLPVEEFSKKLQSALSGNLKIKIKKPSFAKVAGKKKGTFKKGWYRLKIEKTTPVIAGVTPPETDNAHTGKAGEFAVMSELLFWDYNASVMSVDTGIDVIASKNHEYFHIQVKTSLEQEGGKFSFTIKYSSFKQCHTSSMYYVFVLRRKFTNEFIIIPSTYLQTLIKGKFIIEAPTLSISITVDANGKKYTLNGSTNVNVYVGNFSGIIIAAN